MAVRPVKILPDLQTQKQIIKIDSAGNVLFNVSGTLNAGHVSSSLPISGSKGLFLDLNTSTQEEFDNINVITTPYNTKSIYNVNQAFHAIDNSISNAANAYKRVRFQQVGTFDENGSANVALPLQQYFGDAFPVNSLNFINVTVLIKENDQWFNDIVSVNLNVQNSQVYVSIEAPALNNTNEYRLLAVNENPDVYVL